MSKSSKKQQSDLHYKIVLLGDSGVGKTNVITRFTKNQFSLQTKTTIGVQFATKTLEIDQKVIKTQVWDTAGQQRYRSMASAYYRGASGALLVYDITRTSTLENLQKWIKQLKTYASEDIVCLIIGNKADLKHYRAVKFQQGEQLAKKNQMGFIEGSAKDGNGIDQVFTLMIKEILSKNKNIQRTVKPATQFKKQTLKIEQPKTKKERTCCKSS